MMSPTYTKLCAVNMVPEHWEQFKKLARSQGLSSSALLRQLVARALRKAEIDARLHSVKPQCRQRVKGGGDGRRYITQIPYSLPKGRVLVHNHVAPRSQIGWGGFRAWTQRLTEDLEVCLCNWAGQELYRNTHYRIKQHQGR